MISVWVIGNQETASGMAKALDTIKTLVAELEHRTGNYNVPSISPSLTFAVDPQHHLMLQGPQGRNLQHLDAKFGVRVVFPRDPWTDNQILVYGPDEKAKQARDELLELLQMEQKQATGQGANGPKSGNTKGSHERVQPVPQRSLPLIIGKGGSTINGLRSEHNVAIDIVQAPDTDDNSNAKIVIRGAERDCETAQQAIRSIIAADEVDSISSTSRWSTS